MKRILTLVRVMAKSSTENILTGKKNTMKKRSRIGMIFIYAILAVYLAGFVGFFSYLLINSLKSINQEGMSFQLIFLVLNGFTVFTALIAAPSVLYFAKDIEHYIVMPLKPWEILIAKFLTSLLSSYALALLIMVPFISVYIYLIGFNFSTILLYIFSFFLIPIFPSALVTILVIIIFTFIPAVKNKDAFTYFTMFLTVLLSVSLSFSSNLEELDINSLLALVNSGDNSLLSIVQSPFNPSTQFALAIVNHDIFALLFGIILAAALVFVLGVIAQAFYFKGAIGIGEASSKKKELSAKEKQKLSRHKSQTVSLVIQDVRRILRTPILLTNYYFGIILLPILLIIPIFIEGSVDQVFDGVNFLRGFIDVVDTGLLLKAVTLIGFIFGFALTSFSQVASTSFSRDGDFIETLKSMPISMKTLYHSKLIVAIGSLTIVPLFFGILAAAFLNLNIIIIAILIVTIILGSTLSSILGCIFDIVAPKLVWETEQQAIKQNFVSMVAMFVQMGIIGLMVFTLLKLSFNSALIVIFTLSLLAVFTIYHLSLRLLNTSFLAKTE